MIGTSRRSLEEVVAAAPPGKRAGPRRPAPATLLLLAATLAGTLLAVVWVFLVPIFQSPDEEQHFDYVMAIYAAGRPITAAEKPFQLHGYPDITATNPLVIFLTERTGFDNVRDESAVPMPPGYGTAAFFDALNREAPAVSPQAVNPVLIGSNYDGFVYYSLVAAWIALIHLFLPQPLSLLFAARILSVLCVPATSCLGYAALRALGLRPWRASILMSAVALFPLLTFYSSYVQPMSLVLPLMTAVLYGSAQLRRRPLNGRLAALLGVSLGCLAATKLQYGVVAGLASAPFVLPAVLAPGLDARRRLALASWLIGPLVILEGLQQILAYQSFWYAVSFFGPPKPSLGERVAGGLNHFWVSLALVDFWGNFGWFDTPLFASFPAVWVLMGTASAAAGILTVVALARNCGRLLKVARRASPSRALRLALGNPFVNAYLLLFALFLEYEVYGGGYWPGRYWLPVLPAVFLLATTVAPHALPGRRLGIALSNLILAGLLTYSVAASAAAIPTLQARYYNNGRELRSATLAAASRAPGGTASIQYFVPSEKAFFPERSFDVPVDGSIGVGGWVEIPGGPPAAVFVSVDDQADHQAVYGDSARGREVRKDGFDTIFSVRGLSEGRHFLTIRVLAADGSRYFEPDSPLYFDVVPDPSLCAGEMCTNRNRHREHQPLVE